MGRPHESIDALRIKRGLSVAELARLSRVSRSTVIKVLDEDGAGSRPDIVARIKEAVGKDFSGESTVVEIVDRTQDRVAALMADVEALNERVRMLPGHERKNTGRRLQGIAKSLDSLNSILLRLSNKLIEPDREI